MNIHGNIVFETFQKHPWRILKRWFLPFDWQIYQRTLELLLKHCCFLPHSYKVIFIESFCKQFGQKIAKLMPKTVNFGVETVKFGAGRTTIFQLRWSVVTWGAENDKIKVPKNSAEAGGNRVFVVKFLRKLSRVLADCILS
jgi:hypothetical protein